MFQRSTTAVSSTTTGRFRTRSQAGENHSVNKGAMAVKQSASQSQQQQQQQQTRKRRALGDVSNKLLANQQQQQNVVAQKPTQAIKPSSTAMGTRATKRSVASTDMTAPAASRRRAATQNANSENQEQQPSKPAVNVNELKKQVAIQVTDENAVDVPKMARRKSAETKDQEAKAEKQVAKPVFKSPKDIVYEPPKPKRVKTAAELLDGWDDLDADDSADPLMVSEYVEEIFDYLRELELVTMPDASYMEKQPDLQWKMRSVLIDWLVEVHLKFKLLPETLFLTINIMDRFLSERVISLTKLQLVGMTAMFIAAKYEEVYAPPIAQFVYIADGGYTNEEIIKAERYMLATLGFNLQFPNPLNFLRRCSKADNYDIQTRTLAKYFMELALIEESFLSFPPSLVSASSLYLARYMLDRSPWDINLTHYAGYDPRDMAQCCTMMLKNLCRERKYQAIYKKYSSQKFLRCSLFVDDWLEIHCEEDLFGVEFPDIEEDLSEPESDASC